jgi:hypothetical protein
MPGASGRYPNFSVKATIASASSSSSTLSIIKASLLPSSMSWRMLVAVLCARGCGSVADLTV